MKTTDHFVVIQSYKLSEVQKKLTFQLIIDPSALSLPIEDIYSGYIWIVVEKKGGLYLWCRLWPEAIEKLTEDERMRGYLITGDINKSEYFSRLDNQQSRYRIDQLGPYLGEERYGLNRVGGRTKRIFEDAMSSIPIKMLPLEKMAEDLLIPPKSGANIPRWIDGAIKKLKRNYVCEEVYRYAKYPQRWSPYECIAIRYLRKYTTISKTKLYEVIDSRSEVEPQDIEKAGIKHCNFEFKQIEPSEVTFRTMVIPASPPSTVVWLKALEKTDRAERTHQEMLKDIASYLKSRRIVAYESLSIDMFIPGESADVVIELKSATDDNFYRQAVQGAVQLKEYCFGLEVEKERLCSPILIIQKAPKNSYVAHCLEFLQYLGVKMLIYDRSTAWPDRVSGLCDNVLACKPKALD